MAPKNPILTRIELALAQAKRVKRESSLVVQQLAAIRDELQSEEDTNK